MTSENEKDINLEETSSEEEFSTIFSDPTVKNDTVKKPILWKKLLPTVIALVLVVAVTVTLVLTVPVLMNKENTETEDFRIVESEPFDGVDKIVINRSDSTLTFDTEVVETTDAAGDPKTETRWKLANVDSSLTSWSVIDNTVENIMGQTAERIISEDKNDGNDYGFDEPKFKVDFFKGEELSLSLIIGGVTPEGSGRYATTSKDDKVYYIRDYGGFPNYEKDELAFAQVEEISSITADSSVNDSNFNGGVLIGCDKLVISGKNFDDTYTVISKEADQITTFNAYHFTSPVARPADDESIGEIVSIFSYGVMADACYSYTQTEYDLKRFGLDNPDFSATIYVGNLESSFSASLQDDGYYAVLVPGNKTIMKVAASSLAPASYTRKDLYYDFLFIESILAAKQLKVETGGESYAFDITTEYDKESELDQLSAVHSGGKELSVENFKDYYSFVLNMRAVSYDLYDVTGMTPETVLTITHKDGSAPTTVKYYKVASGRYQVETNGIQMGIISSSNHSYVGKYAKNVANNQTFNQR